MRKPFLGTPVSLAVYTTQTTYDTQLPHRWGKLYRLGVRTRAIRQRSAPPSAESHIGRLLLDHAKTAAARALEVFVVATLASRHQVLLFSFGRTVTEREWEPRFYKFLGRRIVVRFNGSDARPPYLNAKFVEDPAFDLAEIRRLTQQIVENVRRTELYADDIVAVPSISHFFSRPIVDEDLLGKPFLAQFGPSVGSSNRQKRDTGRMDDQEAVLRILHCPSRPLDKGTAEIVEAVEGLKGRGVPVEFTVLTGALNNEVLEAIVDSDVVVDQLYSDIIASTLAAEACLLGRATIVGSEHKAWLEQHYSNRRVRPVILVDPTALEDCLYEIAVTGKSSSLGGQAARVMKEDFGISRLFENYYRLLTGRCAPDEYYFPSCSDGTYVFGYGSGANLRRATRGLIEAYGVSSLGLEHRRGLRAEVLGWAMEG